MATPVLTDDTSNMAADQDDNVDSTKNTNSVSHEVGTVKSEFSLEVLHLVKDAQQQHGLRHSDYQRYRSYCSRRLRRLRKSLHFLQGNKHRVIPKKINEEVLTDVRYLYLPLIMAERAWSYAMQLKQEANTEPRKRFHLLSRLIKASKHSQEFEDLCQSDKCDARTKLEAQAYNSWMQGSLKFELHQWKGALENFRRSQTIYEKLSAALVEEEQVFYKQRVDEFSPNIRYCEYNIGDESAINDLKKMRFRAGGGEDMLSADLDALISQTRERQSSTLSTVTWQGRTVAVKHEKVRSFLVNAQESDNEMSKASELESKISVLEGLLLECKDVIQLLRDELKTDPSFKSRTGDSSVSSLHYLYNYLVYIRLTKTIDRNMLMIESLKQRLPVNGAKTVGENTKVTKPQDLIRLYETNLQNLSEVKQLLELDEDSELMHSIEAQILSNKAFRCYYIAQAFTLIKSWTEALALYSRVEEYVRSCMEYQDELSKKTTEELNELLNLVNGQKYSLHALSILSRQGESTTDESLKLSSKDKRPLSDRLDEFYEISPDNVENVAVAEFPPDFRPIPCKPLFFDLALNHVEFPSLDDKLEQKKGSGLTGMVKGWLWGGKK